MTNFLAWRWEKTVSLPSLRSWKVSVDPLTHTNKPQNSGVCRSGSKTDGKTQGPPTLTVFPLWECYPFSAGPFKEASMEHRDQEFEEAREHENGRGCFTRRMLSKNIFWSASDEERWWLWSCQKGGFQLQTAHIWQKRREQGCFREKVLQKWWFQGASINYTSIFMSYWRKATAVTGYINRSLVSNDSVRTLSVFH